MDEPKKPREPGRVARASERTGTARAIADATLGAFLPLIAINAVFVHRVPMQLTAAQAALHHLYDAAHLVALGAVSWVVALLVFRLPRWPRFVVGALLVLLAHYALLAGDLGNFLARHEDSRVPWQLVFPTLTTLAFVASVTIACLLAHGPLWLALAGVGFGLVLGVGNHFVLRLDYPGSHFILALTAAAWIGLSGHRLLARVHLPIAARVAAAVVCACSLLSLLLAPRPVVRSALLSSSGAVVVPFVAKLWASADRRFVENLKLDANWYKSRAGRPEVPPDPLDGAPEKPIVVLLTIDALRSDVVEGESADLDRFKGFRELSKKALRFERAWSPAAYTMASLRSVFLGVYYSQNAKQKPGQVIEPEHAEERRKAKSKGPYLAELLERRGVTTVNVRTLGVLATNRGICRGFGEEIVVGRRAKASHVMKTVLKQVKRHKKKPVFVYAHVYDPHYPYTRTKVKGSDFERYLGEIKRVDIALHKLRKDLRKHKLHKRTYLIVTADHAEAFGEHGRYRHGTTAYEEMIRVPLFIEGPKIEPRRAPHPVTLMDLGPTILSIFGTPTPGHFMGQSLLGLARGDDSKLTRPLATDGGRGIRSMLFESRWKAIVDVVHGTEELYDLEKDPKELQNLADEDHARARLASVYAFFDNLERRVD